MEYLKDKDMTDKRDQIDLDPKDVERDDLEEWRRWAESWIHEVEDGPAGEVGTDELVQNYKKATPGQSNEHDSR